MRAYLEREARATLRSVPGIDLDEYVDTLFWRFTNEAIADTLFRLAQDASSRMPKFVLGTVRDNLTAGGPIRLGAAMVAAWALGEEGVDENGEEIVIDDPLAEELLPLAAAQKAGHETAFISHEASSGTWRPTSASGEPSSRSWTPCAARRLGHACGPWPVAPERFSPRQRADR